MTDTTTHLKLPYLMAAQAQKHVTHNEALRALDALVQLSVADRDLAAPPPSPADGARYLVAGGATGAWTGHAGHIAAFQDGAWLFHVPVAGWLAWVADEATLLAFDGSDWGATSDGGASVNPVALVGVNTTADATNRLAVAAAASLFTHAGGGHQLKLNKAAAGDTASQLFQSGWSGRAEIGLAGDDDLRIKVSADGDTWHEAIVVDRTSGAVAFPNSSLVGATGPQGPTGPTGPQGPAGATGAQGPAGLLANPWAGTTLAALGSSITSASAWPTTLAAALGMTLANLGHSGGSFAASSSIGAALSYGQVAGLPATARLVLVEGPINDWAGNATLGALGDTATSTFYGAMWRTIVDTLAIAPQARVVLLTMYGSAAAVSSSGLGLNAGGKTLAQFNQAMREVAAVLGCPVVDLAAAGLGYPRNSLYTSDGLHPNTLGSALIAAFLATQLRLHAPDTSTVNQVATPTFSPAAGSYASAQTVAIATATAGATIHYTTDGSTPSTASAAYSGTLAVAATATVKAIAVKSGMVDSAVASAAYVIDVGTPTVWNTAEASTDWSLSAANTTLARTAGTNVYRNMRSTTSKSSGKWYVEMKCTSAAAENGAVWGLSNAANGGVGVSAAPGFGGGNGVGVYGTGGPFVAGFTNVTTPRLPGNPAVGKVIAIAVDFDAGKVWFGSGTAGTGAITWFGSGNPATGANPDATFSIGSTGALFPAIGNFTRTAFGAWKIQGLASDQAFAPPSGFSRWGA